MDNSDLGNSQIRSPLHDLAIALSTVAITRTDGHHCCCFSMVESNGIVGRRNQELSSDERHGCQIAGQPLPIPTLPLHSSLCLQSCDGWTSHSSFVRRARGKQSLILPSTIKILYIISAELWERTFIELFVSGSSVWQEDNFFQIWNPGEGFSDGTWLPGSSGKIFRYLNFRPQFHVNSYPRPRAFYSNINLYVEICVFSKGKRL